MREEEDQETTRQNLYKGGPVMTSIVLLITVLVLILVLGMQIQVNNMNKKIDELIGGKPKK